MITRWSFYSIDKVDILFHLSDIQIGNSPLIFNLNETPPNTQRDMYR